MSTPPARSTSARCAAQAVKQGEQAAKLGVGDPKAFQQQRATAEKNVKVRSAAHASESHCARSACTACSEPMSRLPCLQPADPTREQLNPAACCQLRPAGGAGGLRGGRGGGARRGGRLPRAPASHAGPAGLHAPPSRVPRGHGGPRRRGRGHPRGHQGGDLRAPRRCAALRAAGGRGGGAACRCATRGC